MSKRLKKYVAWQAETFKFIGFYEEGRKDLPATVHEIDPDTFMDQIGGHSHYNPGTRTFYTPEESNEEKRLKRQDWANDILLQSDTFMFEDHPINSVAGRREELLAFRQALWNYPDTKVKPTIPDWFK